MPPPVGNSTYMKKDRTEEKKARAEKNKDRLAVNRRRYKERHPLKVKYSSKRADCIKRKIPFEINIEEFVDWFSCQPKTCHYCGREFKDKFDTQIDRKDARGGYRPGNLVLACFMCNRLKSDIFTEEAWLEIVQKYNLVRRYK